MSGIFAFASGHYFAGLWNISRARVMRATRGRRRCAAAVSAEARNHVSAATSFTGMGIARGRRQESAMDDYGRRIIIDSSFERTVDEAIQAFSEEGLDVISSFDVRDYLRRRLLHDFRRY